MLKAKVCDSEKKTEEEVVEEGVTDVISAPHILCLIQGQVAGGEQQLTGNLQNQTT